MVLITTISTFYIHSFPVSHLDLIRTCAFTENYTDKSIRLQPTR